MSEPTVLWCLVAKGHLSLFNGVGKTLCQKLFSSKEKAEAYIPEFRKVVTEERDDSIQDLVDNEALKITPIPLFLEED